MRVALLTSPLYLQSRPSCVQPCVAYRLVVRTKTRRPGTSQTTCNLAIMTYACHRRAGTRGRREKRRRDEGRDKLAGAVLSARATASAIASLPLSTLVNDGSAPGRRPSSPSRPRSPVALLLLLRVTLQPPLRTSSHRTPPTSQYWIRYSFSRHHPFSSFHFSFSDTPIHC